MGAYVRIAVQQGWMNGYTDGSFRPNNAVTLEEACTAVLKLMGYKMTDLSGAFPNAQLNKAGELGLRAGLDRRQGEAMNYEDCAVLLYNALTANNASGSAYGTTLGFTVSNGQVDGSTILLSSLKGPFVASESTVLPFVPASVYRNDKVSGSAELNKYDVYYYSESLKTCGSIPAVPQAASPRCLPRPALPLPLRWQARPTRWAARPLLPRCPPSTAAVSARWSLCCWA